MKEGVKLYLVNIFWDTEVGKLAANFYANLTK